jgi:ferrous iron transport protein A
MNNQIVPLSMIAPGKKVTLVAILAGRGLRRRLIEMGLNEGVELKVIHIQPPGPCIVAINNTKLALGWGMVNKIMVKEY